MFCLAVSDSNDNDICCQDDSGADPAATGVYLNWGASTQGKPQGCAPDPAWHGANNELLFLNSLKMKLSVLIGVVQMVVGVLLRFSNSVYEGSTVDFVFECLPMMAFMMCFFAYMDWMIIYKSARSLMRAINFH